MSTTEQDAPLKEVKESTVQEAGVESASSAESVAGAEEASNSAPATGTSNVPSSEEGNKSEERSTSSESNANDAEIGEKRSLSEEPCAHSNQHTKRPKVEIPEGMSKSQWKKQQRRLLWELRKEEMKKQRKEKKQKDKEKRRAKIEELLAQGLSIEEVREELMLKNRSSKDKTNKEQLASGVGVVYDCGFDEKMNEKEKASLSVQLCRSYGENRRASKYIDMTVSLFAGNMKERFDAKQPGYENWKNIRFAPESLEELLEQGKLDAATTVYLSAEEPEASVEALEEGHTYVIGGLVDKGRYKGLCYEKAKRLGLRTARLPIDEFIQIAGRRVLTSLHVFMLLSKWLEHRDWKKAFEEVLPERKRVATEDGETTSAIEGEQATYEAAESTSNGDLEEESVGPEEEAKKDGAKEKLDNDEK